MSDNDSVTSQAQQYGGCNQGQRRLKRCVFRRRRAASRNITVSGGSDIRELKDIDRTLRFHGIGQQVLHVRAVSEVNGQFTIVVHRLQTRSFLYQIPTAEQTLLLCIKRIVLPYRSMGQTDRQTGRSMLNGSYISVAGRGA